MTLADAKEHLQSDIIATLVIMSRAEFICLPSGISPSPRRNIDRSELLAKTRKLGAPTLDIEEDEYDIPTFLRNQAD